MLNKAATSAYSWWWASHIRTKQSKWLEQNLQDMEEKVKFMLKIIEQEGDSFAKRAEMYYKKRPELIQSVEESYRAYRALAERFDHLSKDLQSANRTIATVFPEQVQLSIESDDEDSFSGSSTPDNLSTRCSSPVSRNMPKAPKLPNFRTPNARAQALLASKREQIRKNLTTSGTILTPNSGLSKEEAIKEIDTYEKDILHMQTEKEFMKTAYENALAMFLELESKITESQAKVCNLQDEFGVGAVIENHEARSLMAGSALRSCADALTKLQQEQGKSMNNVKEGYGKIKEAHERIEDLKEHCGIKDESLKDQGSILGSSFKESIEIVKGEENVDVLREKIKEELKMDPNSATFTAPEMTEKIDDVVEKVISLETTVCSQNALVKRLRQEIEELLGHIKMLEEQKEKLQENSAMRNRLRELEEELIKVKNLNNEVVEKNNSIDVQITEASFDVDHLQKKLQDEKPYEEVVEVEYSKDAKIEQVTEEEKAHKEENTARISEKENYGSDLEQQNEMKEVEDNEDEKQVTSRTVESTIENDIRVIEEEQKEETEQQSEMKEAEDNEDEKQGMSRTAESTIENNIRVNEEAHKEENTAKISEKENYGSDPEQQSDMKEVVDIEDEKLGMSRTSESTIETDIQLSEEAQKEDLEQQNEMKEKQAMSRTAKSTIKNDIQLSEEAQKEEKESYSSDPDDQQSEMKEAEDNEDEKQSTVENDIRLSQEDGINWRKLYMNNMEDRERILVEEYTIILRGYKNMKMKHSETEKNHRTNIDELESHVRELKNSVAAKEEEIRLLRRKLSTRSGTGLEENVRSKADSTETVKKGIHIKNCSLDSSYPDRKPLFHHLYDRDDVIKSTFDKKVSNESVGMNSVSKTRPISRTEGRYRAALDNLLEANLDFWLRFSTTFHQIQKFQSSIKDLQGELVKLKHPHKIGGVEVSQSQIKSDAIPIYKHLREIQTELTLWLEHSSVFQEELTSRFSSLNSMQDEIAKVSKIKRREENELNDNQAAKFQGEILNMKQENNKVAQELQIGIHRVKALKSEVRKVLKKMDKDYGFSERGTVQNSSSSKSKVPLHAFLFGMKLKRHKKTPSQSTMFSCVPSTPYKDKDNSSPFLETP